MKYERDPKGDVTNGTAMRIKEAVVISEDLNWYDLNDQYPGYSECYGECECAKTKRAKKLYEQVMRQDDIPEDVAKYTLDDFGAYPEAQDYARQLVTGGIQDSYGVEKNGLLLAGPTGTGKTTLASVVFRMRVEQQGIAAIWTKYITLIKRVQATYDDEYKGTSRNEIVQLVARAPFLMLDDIGSIRTADKQASADRNEILDEVIDARNAKKLPTIITTNLTLDQLYQHFEPRIISRIEGLCHGTVMNGIDFRTGLRR